MYIICMYVCIYVCVYLSIYLSIYLSLSLSLSLSLYIYIYIYMYKSPWGEAGGQKATPHKSMFWNRSAPGVKRLPLAKACF